VAKKGDEKQKGHLVFGKRAAARILGIAGLPKKQAFVPVVFAGGCF